MVKKLLYTIMFTISTLALMLMLFAPIYKFNDKKIVQNNTEMLAVIYEPYLVSYRSKADLNKLSESSKEEYKRNFKIYNELALAIIEEDPEKYYAVNKYAVLNEIYVNQVGGEAPLDPLSTDAELNLVEKTLVDLLGNNAFESERLIETYSKLNSDKAIIYKRVKESTNLSTNEEVDEFLVNNAVNWVIDEFLLAYFGYDYELIELTTKDFREKGIKFKHIIKALKNAWIIDKGVWNQEEYKDLGFIDKVTAVSNDENFYNPVPLLLLSTLIIVIIIGLIGLIFKGLQGTRGIKYPHAFVNSIINGVIVFCLLILNTLITRDYYLSYHITEYSRLLNLLKFGDFSFAMYLSMFSFACGIVISFMGRFCIWGKEKDK